MKSIQTKLLTLVTSFILVSVLIISLVSILNTTRVVNNNATQFMSLRSTNTSQEINSLLSRISQSVTTLSTYLEGELTNISKFQTDPEYVRDYTDEVKNTVLNAAENTLGALTVYVRYNPEFTEPTSGLFYTRTSADSRFDMLTPTDFSMYDPSDTAHVGWYYIPVNNGTATWMDPYVNENLGINMISYVIPLTVNGVHVGIVGMDIDFSSITTTVDAATAYQSGYAFLVNTSGLIMHHKNLALNTDLNTVENGALTDFVAQLRSVQKEGSLCSYTYGGQPMETAFTPLDNGMKLVLTAPTAEIEADSTSLLRLMVIISIVAVVITVLGLLIMIRRMLRPIRELSAVAERVGDGDLDVSITPRSKDEIGTLARSFGKAVNRLKEYIGYIDEVSAVLGDMSEGQLSIRLEREYVGEFAKVREALEKVSRLLGRTISEIRQVSGLVSVSSEEVAAGAQSLSQGATEQAASIEELSETVRAISNQIEDNAKDAQTARTLSDEAGHDIVESNNTMQQMMVAMDEISHMSEEIKKIAKAIDDISMQTNILALNAAVEAARAGTAGKGFAVVADEVRNLAQKSTDAVKSTTALVEQTIQAVEKGTVLAGAAAGALRESVEKVQTVNAHVASIAQATDEQGQSIRQVQTVVEQISSVVQENSYAAEKSASTSQELSRQTQSLDGLIGRFQFDDNPNPTAQPLEH